MDLFSLFANLTERYRNHYLSLANQTPTYHAPSEYQPPAQAEEPATETPQDRYIPSPESTCVPTPPSTDAAPPVVVKPSEPEVGDSYVPSDDVVADDDAPAPQPATYTFQRSARMDYGLNLKFNLGAMTSTLERMSEDGDVQELSEFAAAGFGLKAKMNINGAQTVTTSATDAAGESLLAEGNSMVKGKSWSRSRAVSRFAVQGRNFAAQGFTREAQKIRHSLDIRTHDGHRRATNKLSMRFRLDSRFNMAYLNQFNVQTQQVAETTPDAVGSYLNSAGNVAEKGTPEMMAAFFDAVDGYLNQAEEKLLAKVAEFFDLAAEELGFSGEMVDVARDQLLGTVESFFDRVDTAVEMLESRFAPSDMIQPTLPIGEVEAVPVIPADPAAAEDRAYLATA